MNDNEIEVKRLQKRLEYLINQAEIKHQQLLKIQAEFDATDIKLQKLVEANLNV